MVKRDIRNEIWRKWKSQKGYCDGCPAHNLSYTPSYGGKEGVSIDEFEVIFVLSDPNDDRFDEPSEDGKLSEEDEEWNYGYAADNGWDMMTDYMNPIVRQIDGHESSDGVYFTNAHKCPPYADDLHEEWDVDIESLENCRYYLRDEIESVNPKVVVSLSNHSIGAVGYVMPNEHEFNGLEYGSEKYDGASKYVEDWIRNEKRFYGSDPAVVAGIHPTIPNCAGTVSGLDIRKEEFGSSGNWYNRYHEELAKSINTALSKT
jgi:hypothetical protein